MATSSALIAAARDNDLLERAIALAAEAGIEDPQAFVEQRRHELASAPVGDGDSTVASVFEYALTQPRYRVGQDPAAVTDDHLRAALNSLRE